MQTLKLRLIFNLVAANHNIVRHFRTVTVNNTGGDSRVEQDLKPWRDIPGPSSLPVIGQLLHLMPGGSLHGIMGSDLQNNLYKQYGPIVRIDGMLGSPPMLVLFDADAVAQIHHGENYMPSRPTLRSLEYYRKKYKRNTKKPLDKPTGLLTDSDEVWKKFRSMVNPIMLQSKTLMLYTNILDEVALDAVKRLKFMRDEKNMIQNNFDEEMNLWALESIGFMALGRRLHCLDLNLPQDSPAKKLIQLSHKTFSTAEKLDLRPNLSIFISTPTFKRAMELYEELEKECMNMIIQTMQDVQSNNQKSDDEKGIVEKLMEIDEDVAVAMAIDMLAVGVDTTSNSMTMLLYTLATNSDKQNTLREEIMSKREQRPYLKACIKESMRILPVATVNFRKIQKDYNIMGYRIPKGTLAMFSHQYLTSVEEHYPRPKEYLPERWIVEKSDPLYYGNAHPFAFSPFGFGVRSCIGRRIAELVLEIFLARMIENFQIDWIGPPMKTYSTIITNAHPPFNFIFNDVKST